MTLSEFKSARERLQVGAKIACVSYEGRPIEGLRGFVSSVDRETIHITNKLKSGKTVPTWIHLKDLKSARVTPKGFELMSEEGPGFGYEFVDQ